MRKNSREILFKNKYSLKIIDVKKNSYEYWKDILFLYYNYIYPYSNNMYKNQQHTI